jgi:hypothetical protein
MSQKLAIYFLGQGNGSRVLDAEHQPTHGSLRGWTVGRMAICDIAFSPARDPNYALVSKRHAFIAASRTLDETEGGTPLYCWTLMDCGDKTKGSTNGTYLSQGGGNPYRLQPGVPYKIQEGDRVQFGCKAAAVKLSYDIDETMGDDSDPPTGAKPKPVAPASAAEATGRTVADVAAIILTGPEGLDKRLWWLLLAAGTGLYLYLRP